MRDLCTIQTIAHLDDIPGKDRIKLASFKSTGWRVIVGLDMPVGTRVIYCEADTLLPVRPEFEFLRARCYNDKWNGFRIRNMKMGGVFSEGIVFPLSVIADTIKNEAGSLLDGLDVTKQMGAVKYDPEALEEAKLLKQASTPAWKKALCRIPFFKNIFFPKREPSSFPTSIIGISDEARVQVMPGVFERIDKRGRLVTITEKLDGQSATYIWDAKKKRFMVCSRKFWLKKPDSSNYWAIAKKYNILEKLKEMDFQGPIAIQGEIVGPGIQGNKYKLSELEFYIYTVKAGGSYVNPVMLDATLHKLGFHIVPVLVRCDRIPFSSVEAGREYAKGLSMISPAGTCVNREGIVIRSYVPDSPDPKMANQFSFKIINPDFEVEHGL